ncbi:hypothetical protein T492DRAFT_892435 [Pavlovales sp. CCMP2436]|nr:hypothetical protein T492DRAFT_892435 [Pavlovales sp. CCMP2436]
MADPVPIRPRAARWVQLAIVLAAVGLVLAAGLSSISSLQQTQWLQAVPASKLSPHLRHAIVVAATRGSATGGSGAAVIVHATAQGAAAKPGQLDRAPFACASPVPAERTLAALVPRYKHQQTGLFFVTFTNKDRLDFGLTWAYQLCRLGLPHYAIGAMDRETLQAGAERGVPMFQMGEHDLGATDFGWNTLLGQDEPRFKLMGQDKVQLLIDILRY